MKDYKEAIYERLEKTGLENYRDILDWLLKDSKGNPIRNETEGMRKLTRELQQLQEDRRVQQYQLQVEKLKLPPFEREVIPAHTTKKGIYVPTKITSKKWTSLELKYLKKYYKPSNSKQIAKQLNRSENAVKQKYYQTFKRQITKEKRKKR